VWRSVATVFVAAAIASSAATGQQAASGVVAGSVVDATGQPIAGAAVRLEALKGGFDLSLPAPDGTFQFKDIGPGRYALSALAEGYAPMEYGAFQSGDSGVPVLVAAQQTTGNLVIALRRAGTISGQLTDDHGDPVTGHVSILAQGPQGLTTVTAGSTDGGGRYRFGDLPPGSFAVLAVPDPSPRERRTKDSAGVEHVIALTPTFYPSTTSMLGASLVALSGGDEASGTNIQIQALPATSVEITVTTAGGRPLDRMQAVLLSNDDRGPARAQWAQDPDASAKATISGVIAGQYRLVVSGTERPAAPNTPFSQEWAVRNVFVDGMTTVAMPVLLEQGATLECHTTYEGAVQPKRGSPAPIRLRWMEGELPKALERAPDFIVLSGVGQTSISGIAPGKYLLQVADMVGASPLPGAAPIEVSLKAARVNGEDVLDLPVELVANNTTAVSFVVSDRQSTVSGAVIDTDGRPRTDLAVVIFARDTRYWLRGTRRIVTSRPDTSGGYEFQGLPGGEYYVTVVGERPPDDLSDSRWLAQLTTSAVRLTIVDGQKHVQNLRVSR
jgi:hypothetical protein